MKTWPAVRRTASGLPRLHHFYRAPAKVVVIRGNPLLAPEVDAFLPFGSWRDRQETFLVVVLHLGPLPGLAELAADFSKALLHRVVQRRADRLACESASSDKLKHFTWNISAPSKSCHMGPYRMPAPGVVLGHVLKCIRLPKSRGVYDKKRTKDSSPLL